VIEKSWPGLAEALGLAPAFVKKAKVDWDRGDAESFSILENNRATVHSAAESALRPMIFRMLTWPSL
jgi:hypothetical protein